MFESGCDVVLCYRYCYVLLLLNVCFTGLCFSPVQLLQTQIPAIVKAVHKQLKEKSVKTRQCCFLLLTELVQVLPGALTNYACSIMPGIQFSLGYV